MSTALTGPADELGLNVQAGVLAALDEANRAGGVIGRTLRLVTLDDGYEPSRTAPNMHKLIEEEKVLAVIGNVGTPTAVAAIPIVNARQVVLFGAYTGAGALRKTPPDRYVINYRASYADETSAMVDALVNEAGISVDEIAFFTQRDAYGDAGYVGGVAAMQRHGLKSEVNIAHGRYERNTDAVENGLADIVSAHVSPRAVIMVGAYAPCAAFIKLAREYGFDPIFLNVSFVGSQPLANVLGDAGEGVIVTQVVPHFDSDLPIAREYRSALAARGGDMQPTFGSFEGYIAGRILLRALSDVTEIPTRESIVDALDGLGKFDIGLGLELELSPDQHSACHEVWPTVIRGGEVVPMSWTDLRR
ncbi:MAG: ABC transporter substrate-binding protein [Phycisphaerales bacterium]|nr:ABC transporter substrate-binding protein [Phycisphaerales bacterium]